MSEIQVIFHVPEEVAAGLKNGTLERVGGVIRRVGDKKIVMWLQEGVLLEQNTAEQLLKQGAEQTQLMQQQLEQLNLLGFQQQIMMGLQVANLAVSVAGFALVLNKLNKIERQLTQIDRKIDKVQQGITWLDAKQIIERLSPISSALSHLRNYKLYQNTQTRTQQLVIANDKLSQSASYFSGLIKHAQQHQIEASHSHELSIAYRGWIMSAQGQMQVMSCLGEADLAAHLSQELKEQHAEFGKHLEYIISDPRLHLQPNLDDLLGLARQAVGAHEIIRGNVLQLEHMRDNQLKLPEFNIPSGHKGLLFCKTV